MMFHLKNGRWVLILHTADKPPSPSSIFSSFPAKTKIKKYITVISFFHRCDFHLATCEFVSTTKYTIKDKMSDIEMPLDHEEIEELEQEAVDLQSRLEGIQSAEMTSVSNGKLVEYITKAREGDMLIVGETENRWEELIVQQEIVDETPAQKGCCSLQ